MPKNKITKSIRSLGLQISLFANSLESLSESSKIKQNMRFAWTQEALNLTELQRTGEALEK